MNCERTASKISIIIPVFNDWRALRFLIDELSSVAGRMGFNFAVVAVDDGSTEGEEEKAALLKSSAVPLTVVTLLRNLGHQRAIAVGLCHAVASEAADSFVVMDSDGEDRPDDIHKLLDCLSEHGNSIVVASRAKRSESAIFRLFYAIFKSVFFIFTGQRMDFGNFSAMSAAGASRISSMYEVLLHYPAAILSSKLPVIRVPIGRGVRYAGRSKMNFIGLAVHGLSAIAAFSDRVLARMLLGCIGILFAGLLMIAVAVIMKVMGATSPGWATTVIGSALALLIETLVATMAGLLIVLNSRQAQIALPTEVGSKFIKAIEYSFITAGSAEIINA